MLKDVKKLNDFKKLKMISDLSCPTSFFAAQKIEI